MAGLEADAETKPGSVPALWWVGVGAEAPERVTEGEVRVQSFEESPLGTHLGLAVAPVGP